MVVRGSSSRRFSGYRSFLGFVVNHNGPLPLGIFVSVDSKGWGFPVSGVESTLAEGFGSVDSKAVTGDIIGRVLWGERRLEEDGGASRASQINMWNDSTTFDYCQRLLLVSIIRMRQEEVE